jgi:hypothetical protein
MDISIRRDEEGGLFLLFPNSTPPSNPTNVCWKRIPRITGRAARGGK